jgi:phosphotransferase system enzyme I (PtsP)
MCDALTMLETLRRIIQQVNAAHDLAQALEIIVTRVKQAMKADVCSVYLMDREYKEHVLMASDGLNPQSVGHVRLGEKEGLVSVVSEREEPINTDNAPAHPRFHYVPGCGEEPYHGFAGVPIIHHRKVLGVLVVQRRVRQKFSEDEVSFLVTMAAQLAGAIAHAEASGGINRLQGEPGRDNYYLEGQPGSTGVAIGTAVITYPPAELDAIPERRAEDIEVELAAFQAAVAAVQSDIQALRERLEDLLAEEDRLLFDAYQLMLASSSLVGKTMERIREGQWAQGALCATIHEHARLFESMDDHYLRERASDVQDLGRRILRQLQNHDQVTREYPPQTILIGEELCAAVLAAVPTERLVGLVSMRGSRASHVAILARALGIPAVMGVTDLPLGRINGKKMIVDGYAGRVYIAPSVTVRQEFLRLIREEQRLSAHLQELRDVPAQTQDGYRIPLHINTGLLADIGNSLDSGAEGIGLYRTEFPFLIRDRFPGEEEQRQIYRQVLSTFAPRPVIMRTLDVGGDKSLTYFPIQEDNPFLGWRGIRITLDHPEIFLTQLRAMLRASVGLNNLRLLLPMVSTLGEVDEALGLIHRATRELQEEGEAIAPPPVGVMVEVPSMVYQVEHLARRVDFLSIGTNDLTQYLLAVDRNNARVASLYDALHPAVVRALIQVVDGAHRQQKPVGVCGELAGDPAAVLLLVGMGMDSLSTSAANLPRIKWVIRSFTRQKASQLLEEILALEDTVAIRRHLNGALERAGLGSLIRAA